LPLLAFDHVNIRTVNLDRMVAWYEAVLGLHAGPRPDFPVPGAWLCLGDTCVLHLIEADPAPMVHTDAESLRMEHFAFRATGMSDFLARLDTNGVAYKLFPFDAMDTVLVFLRDPDGNRIHVDFPAAEHTPA
jgi:catechol 2,3-dioxygenase-like lactoylglutathione lyase family enzyme